MTTINSVVALAGSVAVAAAQYAHKNSTDGSCRNAFTQEVANLRPTYEQAVANAFKTGGGLDVETMNRAAAQCQIDSRLLGEVAQYGVRPSASPTPAPSTQQAKPQAAASAFPTLEKLAALVGSALSAKRSVGDDSAGGDQANSYGDRQQQRQLGEIFRAT